MLAMLGRLQAFHNIWLPTMLSIVPVETKVIKEIALYQQDRISQQMFLSNRMINRLSRGIDLKLTLNIRKIKPI
jgi:hypothetical protein